MAISEKLQRIWQRDEEKNRALLTMDRAAIVEFMRKWNTPEEVARVDAAPDQVFFVAVHKLRAASRSLPLEERVKSKKWLRERGYGVPGGNWES